MEGRAHRFRVRGRFTLVSHGLESGLWGWDHGSSHGVAGCGLHVFCRVFGMLLVPLRCLVSSLSILRKRLLALH